MKGFIFVILSAIFITSVSGVSFALNKWDNLLVESARVFEEMTEMPEQGIPESLVKDSYAIAIFPSTIKGGFIIGGAYGQGVVIAKDKKTKTWSAPAVFSIAGGSFGWQIGGQASDIILLIMNERGLDGLLQAKLKLGGDIAVAAGPYGRNAQVGTDIQLKGGILSYSRTRGLFAGINLEGSALFQCDDANKYLYGKELSARDIVMNKEVKSPESGNRLSEVLSKF